MVDRLIHHAELMNLKGDSYRLKDPTSDHAQPDLATPPDAPREVRAAGISLRSPMARGAHRQRLQTRGEAT